MIFALLLIGLVSGPPISVRLVVPAGPHYVGQEVDLRVVAMTEGDRPRIDRPKLDGAEILGSTESTLRIVPRKPGPLFIPPIVARQGDRSGSTRPLSLQIREPPIVGRPATFLGGIGPLSVDAEVEPASVRVGETFEYRIRLNGPGSIGSIRRPTVDTRPRIEPLEERFVADPPSRTSRFRLRGLEPGILTLPPLAVASFDPVSGRYLTYLSKSNKIRIVEVEPFDTSRIVLEPEVRQGSTLGMTRLSMTALAVVAIGISGLTLWKIRHRRIPPIRRLRAAILGLDPRSDPSSIAGTIMAGLEGYLGARMSRMGGVLTPREAAERFRASFKPSTPGVPELAEAAARLVADCDQVLYGGHLMEGDRLVSASRRWLIGLEEVEREVKKRRERHS